MPRQTHYIFREARIEKNISIPMLSHKLKINSSKIRNWETSGSKISIKNLKLLSKELNVSPNKLVFNEPDHAV